MSHVIAVVMSEEIIASWNSCYTQSHDIRKNPRMRCLWTLAVMSLDGKELHNFWRVLGYVLTLFAQSGRCRLSCSPLHRLAYEEQFHLNFLGNSLRMSSAYISPWECSPWSAQKSPFSSTFVSPIIGGHSLRLIDQMIVESKKKNTIMPSTNVSSVA